MWRAADLGASLRVVVGDAAWEMFPHSWATEYDADARKSIDQILSRLIDGMTEYGSRSLENCGRDGEISLCRIPTCEIDGRGDRRYGPTNLALFLQENPGLDLTPMICGRLKDGRFRILDGHHRFRAYAKMGRDALVLVGRIRSGSGVITIGSISSRDLS